jgi:leucyl/phenylalanyl-tRNA--protein transferase
MAELRVGANLPWIAYGQDFGASAWRPLGGVAQADRGERMRQALATLAGAGAGLVRWWLLGDGRSGLRVDADGHPLGLDDAFFADLDAAIEALRASGLKAVFVLVDFLWFAPPSLVSGVQTGGRRELVASDTLRAELVEKVFAPIARRYANEAMVAAWDLFNEPDWSVFGLGTLDPRSSIQRSTMRRFLADLASVFRREGAKQPLTVGLARASSLPLVDGLDLDLYQMHWYETEGHGQRGRGLRGDPRGVVRRRRSAAGAGLTAVPVYRLDERLLFPPPSKGPRRGPIAIGGDLQPERLLLAYSMGIFPWQGEPLHWHSPDPRMVLAGDALRVSRSLAKTIRQRRFDVRLDTAFRSVMEACASAPRPGQEGTWITPAMVDAYGELHRRGFAHSCEAWQGGQLVGGLYGVSLGAAFFGESMFAHVRDASKVAFVALVRQLARWRIPLVDCQVYTPHLESLGAREWPRRLFLETLRGALHAPTRRGPWRFDHDLFEESLSSGPSAARGAPVPRAPRSPRGRGSRSRASGR